jgi:hypothetical protein
VNWSTLRDSCCLAILDPVTRVSCLKKADPCAVLEDGIIGLQLPR